MTLANTTWLQLHRRSWSARCSGRTSKFFNRGDRPSTKTTTRTACRMVAAAASRSGSCRCRRRFVSPHRTEAASVAASSADSTAAKPITHPRSTCLDPETIAIARTNRMEIPPPVRIAPLRSEVLNFAGIVWPSDTGGSGISRTSVGPGWPGPNVMSRSPGSPTEPSGSDTLE